MLTGHVFMSSLLFAKAAASDFVIRKWARGKLCILTARRTEIKPYMGERMDERTNRLNDHDIANLMH